MTIDEIIGMDITGKNVLIIGCPASGKTWLSKKISYPSHITIHTDDYAVYGYQESLYHVLNAVNMTDKPTIVEGVQGYRMLRKGVELGCYYPDIVIELKISDSKMMQTYLKERIKNKIKYITQFKTSLEKILNEYRGMCPKHKQPEWIIFFNNY